MRRLASVLLLLPLACVVKVNDGGSGEPPDDQDEPSKPNTTGADLASPEVEGEPPKRAEAPDCPADADVDTYCTEDGKLAGRWVPVDTLHPPAGAQPIFDAQHPDLEKQPSLTISLEGETLYIEKVTCGSCRRVIGDGFSGDLDALNDEHLIALQVKLGLSLEAPLLDSAEAWRSFAGDERGKGMLMELSASVDP
jgi:hypothetical protein